MRKRNENVVYHLKGTDSPITRESIEHYSQTMVFFVADNGLVIPIESDEDAKTVAKLLTQGLCMYKQQLIELLFCN